VPRVIDRLASPEGAGSFCDHHAILPDDEPVGKGMHIDGTANGSRQDRVSVVVERTVQVFETEADTLWKPSKGPT
jgi:hypothetical protein